MKSIIARLEQVIETKKDYSTPARLQIGKLFKMTRVLKGGIGVFEKVNSDEVLSTSKVKSVEIVEGLISIATENAIYYFEVL